jgi:alpha-amylase/alpha-mannosidase (GH57 family)
MSVEPRLKVVLCWHMHQPDYRDPQSGEYLLPWTYLHAIKDYIDMAAHLEAVPRARAVINFVPILLDQIEDYAGSVRNALTDGTPIRDFVLAALLDPPRKSAPKARVAVIEACLRANEKRMIERFPEYRRLAMLARVLKDDAGALPYLDQQFVDDIIVWYHLAWLGETVRRRDARVRSMMEKGQNFTPSDRRVLMTVIGELLGGVIPRYRELCERGQIELSVSPYAHPILPLLQDLSSAREAMPSISLPEVDAYPHGNERAKSQVDEAMSCFERHFDRRPRGCWPSEGAVSGATLGLLTARGFHWTASGEGVLKHSLQRAGQWRDESERDALHRPYRLTAGGDIGCFFRSDRLSDLIGFEFADWHAEDAVAHLVAALEDTARDMRAPHERVVSIILDGENAWEHYPDNGYHFLDALYRRLAHHEGLELTTFSECLDSGLPVATLPTLVAGSWVYGTFSTWIGEPDKNRGWEMLCAAKRVFDAVSNSGRLSGTQTEAACRRLAVCESSDWFWWFGDGNPHAAVRDFDGLFRAHLRDLYRLLGEPAPGYLRRPFTRGGGSPDTGGAMRRATGID